MGVVGCILGGFANYQYFEKWATFGALLPFSGFAMAVGMKMIGPWTKDNAGIGKAIWPGLWLVIWFNVVGAVVCILFGYACTMAGVQPVLAPKVEGAMLFVNAYIMGGILCAVFQICYLAFKAVYKKAAPVHILMFAWMVGAILAPFGISGSLVNQFGEGFAVMIPIGGLNMYNVGAAFAVGQFGEGLVHLGSFLLAVFFLFFTGLCTFLIYNAKFGRSVMGETHYRKAMNQVDDLMGAGYKPEGMSDADAEIIKKAAQAAVNMPKKA